MNANMAQIIPTSSLWVTEKLQDGREVGTYAYDTAQEAHEHATLIESRKQEGVSVRRWVRVDGPEWNASTPLPGWREVSYFNV